MPSLIDRIDNSAVALDSNCLGILDTNVMGYEYVEFTGNGLVAVHDSGFVGIATEQESGDIHVTAELWDGPPPLHLDDWQDAAEISITWPTAIMEIGDEDTHLVLRLPGPGTYRLLAHGRNRDDGDVRDDDDPVETYLIQLWPAPIEKPLLHKATSAYGATLREPDETPKGQRPDWYDKKTVGYGRDHPAHGQ
ncbi:hypothetical protein [Streptomyces hygroscopicus]|uniref:hypothetical protein n=1 Tax=Streptomyces hygroscopicus TaxID=1912 RepID=UPI00223F8679|nr:hypothetical protein [Streptomyces hygroscopicus]